MHGKIITISGRRVVIELDETPQIGEIQAKSAGQQPTASVEVEDARKITDDQRRKIYALLRDLEEWSGEGLDWWKRYFKDAVAFTFNLEPFSLASCSQETASRYILTVLNFLFENDIPFKSRVWDSLPTGYPKQALCIKNKRCVICGKPADLAHFNAVGMGRNRNHINHRGMYIMTLCRVHHTEQHKTGINEFIKKYHIKPIKVTASIAKRFKLGNYKGA